MRCYICDAALSAPNFNADHGDYEPCERCLIVIQDTIGAFMSKPAADEDDLGGPEEPDSLFPPDDYECNRDLA